MGWFLLGSFLEIRSTRCFVRTDAVRAEGGLIVRYVIKDKNFGVFRDSEAVMSYDLIGWVPFWIHGF